MHSGMLRAYESFEFFRDFREFGRTHSVAGLRFPVVSSGFSVEQMTENAIPETQHPPPSGFQPSFAVAPEQRLNRRARRARRNDRTMGHLVRTELVRNTEYQVVMV